MRILDRASQSGSLTSVQTSKPSQTDSPPKPKKQAPHPQTRPRGTSVSKFPQLSVKSSLAATRLVGVGTCLLAHSAHLQHAADRRPALPCRATVEDRLGAICGGCSGGMCGGGVRSSGYLLLTVRDGETEREA